MAALIDPNAEAERQQKQREYKEFLSDEVFFLKLFSLDDFGGFQIV